MVPVGLNIYVDASKIESGAGFAVITKNQTIKIKLKSASIFTGEAYAILHASEVANVNSSPNVVIFSDSMSVIKVLPALKNNKHEIIQKIQENFTELVNNNKNKPLFGSYSIKESLETS